MKLLCLSAELRELTDLVKKLLRIGIRCAVYQEPGCPQSGVWIQEDADFPQALKILVDQKGPRPLPAWACLLGVAQEAPQRPAPAPTKCCTAPAIEAKTMPSVVVVRSEGTTRTGTRRFYRTAPAPAQAPLPQGAAEFGNGGPGQR